MGRSFHLTIVSVFLSVFILCAIPIAVPAETVRNIPSVDVYFSPRGGCTRAIVTEIDNARSEIMIQAYSFTSAPIAKALVNAHKRGVKIVAILDKSQRSREYTSASFLVHAGIPVYIDSDHAIAHNKVIIIDGNTVITGSFNFTKAAEEKNAENLQIIRSTDVARLYLKNFDRHMAHSEFYR
ncbi:MAG: phospholipase D family protein [Syntrophaceae bacterium]|nr:phospholipase D family protein [Syntrophaceae bacterium]